MVCLVFLVYFETSMLEKFCGHSHHFNKSSAHNTDFLWKKPNRLLHLVRKYYYKCLTIWSHLFCFPKFTFFRQKMFFIVTKLSALLPSVLTNNGFLLSPLPENMLLNIEGFLLLCMLAFTMCNYFHLSNCTSFLY